MIQKVILPQLGQTMEEGTIEKWYKKEGDKICKGEVLFDVTTDKATLEVESFVEGIIKKILINEGESAPVNDVVALVGDPEDEVPSDFFDADDSVRAVEDKEHHPAGGVSGAEHPAQADGPVVMDAPARSHKDTDRIFISPRARKIAGENYVPIQAFHSGGSGPGGRVIEQDVKEYLGRRTAISFTPSALRMAFNKGVDLLSIKTDDGGRISEKDVMSAAERADEGAGPGEIVELSAMRKTIASRMSESKQTVPHFYMAGKVHMRAAMSKRSQMNAGGDLHITITDMIVKAAAIALKRHPRLNARFEGDRIAINSAVNIGVAVAVDDGLFVPVVSGADSKDMEKISAELKELVAIARKGKLRPDQYEGGSITISNLGVYGIEFFLPIINPPESCIMGIGAINEEIVVQEGCMRIEPLMNVAVSADHRVTDGASAADFFRTFKNILEDPAQLD